LSLSEFDLIARHFAPMAAPGALSLLDDAAFLTPPQGHDLVLTKDMLVAGVHFFPDDSPRLIAMKALRVNLSDLAAKGAVPAAFLLGLALPGDINNEWLASFAEGLDADSAAYSISLHGGDTVRTSGPLTVSITAIGTVPSGRMVRRLAMNPGDAIYVTGSIGGASIGLQLRLNPEAAWAKALSPTARDFLLDAYLLPRPRNSHSAAVLAYANACMDVSDGFIGDLTKMLAGSGCGAAIALHAVPHSPAVNEAIASEPALLATALTGGDDYELLIAVPPEHALAFEAALPGQRLARIGTAGSAADGIRFFGHDGAERHFAQGSFRHF
jgi:thiamine-monophosphate kinase